MSSPLKYVSKNLFLFSNINNDLKCIAQEIHNNGFQTQFVLEFQRIFSYTVILNRLLIENLLF